jgi:hypothetical protein
MQENTFKLNKRWLLSLYLLLPITLAVVAVDSMWLGGRLRDALPANPETLPIFTYVFVLPHIVSSSVILMDREYLKHFGRRLAIAGLVILVLAVGMVRGQYQALLYGLFNLYTIYHVVQQQFGITRMLCRYRRWEHYLWSGSGLLLMSWAIIAHSVPTLRTIAPSDWVMAVALLTSPLLLWATARLNKHSSSRLGSYYLWANTALVGSTLLCYWTGYFFFMLLVPRLLHDFTAFSFYIVHDANRNQVTPHNRVFAVLRRTRIPLPFLTPLVSILLAAPITANTMHTPIQVLFMFLTMLHYYTEGITWKSGSPHRASI